MDANPQAASRSGTVAVNGQRTTITQTGRPCTFDLTAASTQFDSTGGSGRITVDTLTGCSWRATTNAPWIQIASTVMTGSGGLSFEVSANNGAARDAAIVVADKQIIVAQAAQAAPAPPDCTPTVMPLTIDAASTASTQTIQISIGATCAWSATSGAPWLTITSPGAGTGSAALTVAVAANPGVARAGTLTVAGQAVTVRQAAVACTFTVNPTSQSFGSPGGGGGRFTVNTLPICTWSASKSVPWIDIVLGTGTGTGDVTFTVQANTVTNPRAGTITVGGQVFTVNQSAGPCLYSLAPATLAVPAGGGRQRLTVTTSSNCSWTAVSGAPFVVVANQSQSGTGSGDINFDVDANPTTTSRMTTITVDGQTTTITQAGVACTYALNPPSDTVVASGAASQFTVTTQPVCGWTAIAAAPWVTINAPANGSGTGTGDVRYTVQANADSAPRVTTITVGGQAHTVTQNGAASQACTYALNPSSAPSPVAGGLGMFTVTTQSGCAWTATTSDMWITVSIGSGSGTADVSYTVQPNATGASRTGTITAGGQAFTLTQAP